MFMEKAGEGILPHFEIMTFTPSATVSPDLAGPLITLGAPKSLLERYRATNELTRLEMPQIGSLVCFGICGVGITADSMCLNPHSDEIIEVFTHSTVPLGLVSSSLTQFTASVRAVYNRVPFDSWHSGENMIDDDVLDRLQKEWDTAADELEETLEQIDAVAMDNRDGFWYTFLDDIRNGDYSTKSLLIPK